MNAPKSPAPGRYALTLSGGGARGAYEVGVLRYLREELPQLLGHHARFDVLTGTSVGAINACFLAATQDVPAAQGESLQSLWTELSLERVYKVQGEDLWTISRKLWRAATNEPLRPEGWRLYDILHPEPLEEMVRTRINWPQISANLARGLFSSIAITATHVSSGKNTVFLQQRDVGIPPWSNLTITEVRETILGPEHALSSAAIPLLFRSVRIGDEYFCDGSLRQNTPLAPALRLGADKVLIISLRHKGRHEVPAPALTEYPTTPLLMGKVLNALMLDHTDDDLSRLRQFNTLLRAGEASFGKDFLERVNEGVRKSGEQPYRIVEDLVIRPSRNIASIAAEHTRRKGASAPANSLPTKLLHRIAQSQLINEADLASYLLFDGDYAKALITLGMEDAHASREALVRFYSEPVTRPSRGQRRPGPRTAVSKKPRKPSTRKRSTSRKS